MNIRTKRRATVRALITCRDRTRTVSSPGRGSNRFCVTEGTQ